MKTITLLLSLSLLLNFQAYCQDVEDVFNDGGMSSSTQQLGVNAAELVNGYFTMYYERYTSSQSGIGVQLGVLINDGIISSKYFNGYTDFTSGIMFKVYYKGYYKLDYRGLFFEWDYSFRYREQEKYKNTYHGIGFSYGYRLFFYRFGLSIYGGPMYGIEFKKEAIVNNGIEKMEDFTEWKGKLQIGLNISYNF